MKKNIIILSSILAFFSACQIKDIQPEQVFKTEDDIKNMLANEPYGYVVYDETAGGLNKFVADYMTEKGNYMSDSSLYRTRATGKGHLSPNEYLDTVYVFSIDTLPSQGKGIYIRGRITTDDNGGNFYKSLVIQQIVNGKQQNLRISLDAGSASGIYAMGQEILIRVNGLAIGRYANQPQLCVPSYSNNVNANKAEEKAGWAPGRIPFGKFQLVTTLCGKPDISKLMYEEIKISDFVNNLNLIEARERDGMLVRLKNVHFTGQYSNYGDLADCKANDPETNTDTNVFAPYTENMGYPQGRVIADENGNYTLVSTSEYAKYARYYLPAADYVGTVEGILGFYHDNNNVKIYSGEDSYAPAWDDWSISLRNLDDLKLVSTDDGTTWYPVEYHKQ